MIHPHWDWLDPIHGVGYQWWSGLGLGLIAAAYRASLWIAPTRCTQFGCRRRARWVSAAGVAFCSRHLPVSEPVAQGKPGAPAEARAPVEGPERPAGLDTR